MIKGLGVSEVTSNKQKEYKRLISAHLSIVKRIFRKGQPWVYPRYQYIEMNAGPGRYSYSADGMPEEEIVGSPVIFLEEAYKVGIEFDAYFIERKKESMEQLRYYTELPYSRSGTPNIHYILGDNKNKLPAISLPMNSMGMIYADPNASCPHIEMLTELFRGRKEYDKMDLLINLGSTGIKFATASSCRNCGLFNERGNYYNCIAGLKKYKAVREYLRGRWGFTWGIFSNHPLITHKFGSMGFVNGDRADDFFKKIMATKEYLNERRDLDEHRYDET